MSTCDRCGKKLNGNNALNVRLDPEQTKHPKTQYLFCSDCTVDVHMRGATGMTRNIEATEVTAHAGPVIMTILLAATFAVGFFLGRSRAQPTPVVTGGQVITAEDMGVDINEGLDLVQALHEATR